MNDEMWWSFEGSIVELFAQQAHEGPGPLRLLIEELDGYFDPSMVMLSLIGSHVHNEMGWCKTYCPLAQLLCLGATANAPGYSITPLQIAVACWDFEGVKMLLEAGADPNGTGNPDVVEWRKDSILGRFNHLRDASPLHICRDSDCLIMCPIRTERTEAPAEIETILLQYGAEAFHRLMKRGVEIPVGGNVTHLSEKE